MFETLTTLTSAWNITPQMVLIIGMGLGALTILGGVAVLVGERNPAADRIAASATKRREQRRDFGLLQAPNHDPKGIWKALLPGDMKERSDLSRKLSQAGYNGPHNLRNFTLVRVVLGLGLPGVLLAVLLISRVPDIQLPFDISSRVSEMSNGTIVRVLSVLIFLGYFVPIKWLNDRAEERRMRIEESFPNALDLMQISVEAGLGFDAAMTRVGNELAEIAPEMAYEFLTVQRQIQAGRDRDAAMQDMAQRTNVDVIRSFSAVVSQSVQFGTSMSEALTAYAKEMREFREVKAQEMANKLPVKMSVVLASLMLPALILISIGPVVIRYTRFFAE
ncbi:type II secretion system F family protein [Falsihalocynthiibacter sp. S25ZX9]|uniref:type II secretion system F family protein n=1 Tax=Falsihalocynthiibacter sp. S25ZX9 TaxID=3240870 RepID=UPI0035108494